MSLRRASAGPPGEDHAPAAEQALERAGPSGHAACLRACRARPPRALRAALAGTRDMRSKLRQWILTACLSAAGAATASDSGPSEFEAALRNESTSPSYVLITIV